MVCANRFFLNLDNSTTECLDLDNSTTECLDLDNSTTECLDLDNSITECLDLDNSTTECLDLDGCVINVMGDMLFKLNSTHSMIDVPKFRRLAALVFQYYTR